MFRRRRDARDFDAEIDAHLALEAARLQEDGLSEEQARAEARRAFGNVTRARERFYESRRWLWWDHFRQDLRHAARLLRKSPGHTAILVLTIALGIGATTAIFSVIDATLLHALPYPRPDRLVSVVDDLPGTGARNAGLSQPEWQDLQRSGIFDYVSPAWFDENNLTGLSQPERVRLLIVAPNYFALLGVPPQLGRAFNPEDHRPGLTPEVVISDGFWKRGLGGDPHVLNRSVRLDTDLYEIVGVMPPGFRAPGRTPDERAIDVWASTSFYGAPMADHPPRARRNLPGTIARLKPGLTIEAAQRRVDALVATLQQQFPGDYPAQYAWRVRLEPLKEAEVGEVRRSLTLLFAAVALVLLIACVNVANLLLARASARGREMAMRQALGAVRARLTRQMLTEGMLLSALGGLTGVATLLLAKGLLLQLVPAALPRLDDIAINRTVLLFAVAASLTTGVMFGLVPAAHMDRLDLVSVLRQGRAPAASRAQARTRRLLVIAQFALSLALLVAAGLLLRSFWELSNARLGFNPENVMSVRTRLPYPNDPRIDAYATPRQEAPFLRELLRGSGSLRGVEEAAIGDTAAIPLDQSERDLKKISEGAWLITLEGHGDRTDRLILAERSSVTPEYFHLLGLTLLRGRLFDAFDADNAPAVAVINEAFAEAHWPNRNPLGKRFKSIRADSPWITVVGVIANARTESLPDTAVPKIFLNLYQTGGKHLAIFLRGRMDAGAIPEAVRKLVQSVDPALPVFGAQRLTDTVSASLSQRRFSMEMVALFALTALLLAGLGIYGVTSYMVGERTHEIGIRLALGADKPGILRMVMRQGLAMAMTGAAVGLVAALFVSRLMTGLLYGVRATDPVTFAGVAVLLIGVALLACSIPARRAVRVDPIVALRFE